MKNKKIVIAIIIIVMTITLLLIYNYYNLKPSNSLRWTQEYVAGKGNIKGDVDVNIFGTNPVYGIGANKDGYAVFKNPTEAFVQMKKDCVKGLKAIQQEFYFAPISNRNFDRYKAYGWQLNSNEDEEVRQQALFVTQFLDIYENSFK